MSRSDAALSSMNVGFRSRFVTHAEIEEQLRRWHSAHPDVTEIVSIGRSPEGRDLWVLKIGRDLDRTKPAAWVDANMHAGEFCGSSVALAIAEDVIAIHRNEPVRELPEHLGDLIREDVHVYVMPRMSPDGAEIALTQGRFVRSNVRDHRKGRSAPFWRPTDVDGDGKIRLLRVRDETGDFVTAKDAPDLMLPRRVEDAGPFYRVYPEGLIENWDGFSVPAPSMMDDQETDLNRNFPYGWQAEPQQSGAGAFPASEPESRGVTLFATEHPNIFAWMNLHTFGGVYIRPSGERTDKEMNQSDLAVYRQIEQWCDAYSGYPMVSGYEEFTYEPNKPLCGDLTAFVYNYRGAIAFVCELWDFFRQAGLEVHRPFVNNYLKRTRQECFDIAAWDRTHNESRIIGSWRPFSHPQLGEVEIGGYDPRIGIWNPPPDRLHELCTAQSEVFLRLAAMAPRVRIADLTAAPIGDGLTEISATIENAGYLPTYVLASALDRPFNEPLRGTLAVAEGMEIVSGDATTRIGHLEGWGGFAKWQTPIFARSAGAPTKARIAWVVRGTGTITLDVESVRVGRVSRSIVL